MAAGCLGVAWWAASGSSGSLSGLLDASGDLLDLVVGVATLGHLRTDLATRAHDSCVILATELFPDLGRRHLDQLAAQVHGDVAGVHHGLPSSVSLTRTHRR